MTGKTPVKSTKSVTAVKMKTSNQYAYIILPVILFLSDYCAVLCAEQLSFTLRNLLIVNHGELRVPGLIFYVITPLIYIVYLHICESYTSNKQFWRIIAGIFKASVYAIFNCVILLYIIHIAEFISRLYMGFLGIFAFLFIVLFRYIIKKLLDSLQVLKEPVLLMGAGKNAALILDHIKNDIGLNYQFIGYLKEQKGNNEIAKQLPCLGTFSDAANIIQKTGIRKVLVVAPELDQSQMEDIIYDLQPLVSSIGFIPDMGTMPLSTMDIESLVDGHVVMFQMRNNLKNRGNRILKFVFDWFLTLVGTICIAPIFAVISIWIYLDSPGPVIFKHRRVGKDGNEFDCYKFRSMCVDADRKLKELLDGNPKARKEWEKDFKLKEDPRITKSGAFLRKTSLDELPQIFNVLKGEMSLVGPRPIIRAEVPRYGKYISDYYMVRPGITGLWQTSGRNDIDYNERVQMDTWYVRNWNIWFDIVLLWRTFKAVLAGKGAY